MNVDKKWAFLDHLSTSSWNVVCEQPLRQIFNPILLPCKNIFGFCQSESTFAWLNESTMNFCYFWEKDQCTKLNVIKYCQVKGWWKSLDTFKVVSWESEPTPSATPFFKRVYKISHPPRLWVSWIDLPSFASSSKIWPNFSNKVFF